MAEFLPPSMPERQEPVARPETATAASPATPEPAPEPARRSDATKPGALARLVSLVLTVGLAWALTVAITAWLLGLFLSRG